MRGIAVLGAGVAAALLAAGGAWFAFAGGEVPAPVSIDGAASSLQSSSAGTAIPKATASVVAATFPNAPATGGSAPAPRTAAAEGARWAVEGTSFVGYRVSEQLAGIGANTAVGRTSAVSGDLSYDGRQVTALEVKADMRQLKSDDNRRDNFLRRQSLETDRHPDATFVLAEPIAVSVQPAEGATQQATARGDLTVHGVTQRVDIPVEGKMVGDKLLVVGSVRVPFADFRISPPRVPLVLSLEEDAVIELSLVFAPSAS